MSKHPRWVVAEAAGVAKALAGAPDPQARAEIVRRRHRQVLARKARAWQRAEARCRFGHARCGERERVARQAADYSRSLRCWDEATPSLL